MKYRNKNLIAIICLCSVILMPKGLNIGSEYLERTTVANLASTTIIEVNQTARISCYVDKGIMANGEQTRKGVVAVSDRSIPLNSKVYVEEFGELTITDRTNKRIHKQFGILTIDVWMTEDECKNFGLKYLTYKIYE